MRAPSVSRSNASAAAVSSVLACDGSCWSRFSSPAGLSRHSESSKSWRAAGSQGNSDIARSGLRSVHVSACSSDSNPLRAILSSQASMKASRGMERFRIRVASSTSEASAPGKQDSQSPRGSDTARLSRCHSRRRERASGGSVPRCIHETSGEPSAASCVGSNTSSSFGNAQSGLPGDRLAANR